MEISGSTFANTISHTLDNLSNVNKDIQAKMNEISSLTDSADQQQAMIEVNFMIGQYNAMMELTSSLTKNLTDSIKSIAQKV